MKFIHKMNCVVTKIDPYMICYYSRLRAVCAFADVEKLGPSFDKFSPGFKKGDDFSDFLFAFLYSKLLLNKCIYY